MMLPNGSDSGFSIRVFGDDFKARFGSDALANYVSHNGIVVNDDNSNYPE